MNQDNHPQSDKSALLERKIFYCKIILMIERVWVTLWFPLGITCIFTLISLTGIWPFLAPWLHKLGLALFGLVFIISFFPLFMCRWPTRKEALKRLEEKSGLKHYPISAYEDNLGNKNPSRITQQLWLAHKQRLMETFDKLKFGRPKPRVDRLDPYAIRLLLPILLALSLLATGNLVSERINSAFTVAEVPSGPPLRLDAWVRPPSYTGKAAIILSDGSSPLKKGDEERRYIHVPQNSKLVIRMNKAQGRYYKVFKGKTAPNKGDKTFYEPLSSKDAAALRIEDTVRLYELKLTHSTSIKIRNGSKDIHSWQIFVQQDQPPRIRLLQPVSKTTRNSMKLTYHVSDDYGVKSAKARITKRTGQRLSIIRNKDIPLGEAPEFSLALPGRQDGGTKSTFQDLTAHPWAGLRAYITLSAQDHAGQENWTKPIPLLIPSRSFTKPLARALAEQRKKLVAKPYSNYFRVKHALNALTLSPETFTPDLKVYLGIRSAYWRMEHNRSRAAAESVAAQLWELALYIEDGNLSEAERQMKLAQDRLAKSLREGAPGDEIRRQLDELRTAIARFVQEIEKQQGTNLKNNKSLQGLNAKNAISAEHLDKMLRQIEELAKSGSRELAAQMLNNLRNILENLQTNSPQNNTASEQMLSALDNLNSIASGQQKLHDESFSQKRNTPEVTGQNQKDFNKQNQQLSKRQDKLKKLLNDLIKKMKRQGFSPEKALEQAKKAMEAAGQALEQSNLDRATQQQALVLDKLRKGTQSIARRLMQQIGRGPGRSPGQRDPFGRQASQAGNRPEHGRGGAKLPDQFDIRRAREILKELRNRFGESDRPPVELDYLERLLQRF